MEVIQFQIVLKKLTDDKLNIEYTGNGKDQIIPLKIVSYKNGVYSKVVEKNIEFIKVTENDIGTKVYVGQAECSGLSGEPYTVKVRVTTVNGKIAFLEDNGTDVTANTDYGF